MQAPTGAGLEFARVHAPTLTALEFARVQQELADQAACGMGKELALHTLPLASPALVARTQQETTEAKELLGKGRAIPFGGIQDVRAYVERAASGGVLRPDHLTAVADTIYGCRQLHRFLTEQRAAASLLVRHAEAFGQFDHAEEEIRRCIERGSVASRASRSLKQIRGELAVLEGRIQERCNGLLRQYRQHLQEALITNRDGRYVLPVKVSARSAVPGVAHGASASGSTIFVEPESIRQLSDELESWRAMEEAEVEQVLSVLSGHVAAHADGLRATLGAVAQLDLIFARARLSRAWDAHPVLWHEVEPAGLVDLIDARHPLLGRAAIGNHIRMTPAQRMLIVTGPNTGGKTLLLKTLGLLVLIARCGMHIPVAPGSSLCHFDLVFADIGDQQSLEQSLSTFSGHITNVAPMLAQAGPRTLVLLDELGSGTDPHEGTGLGIALLEAFLAKGAYTLATTHLREIKEFGRNTPGCAYAGMGFDGETLQPTYRLRYGTLGESHGLEIAARSGLPVAVVERAQQLVYGGAPRLAAAAPLGAAAVVVNGDASPPCTAAVVPALPSGPLAPVPPAPAHGRAAPAPVTDGQTLVLGGLTAGRCRVWHDGAERELSLGAAVRRLHPSGLVPGDHVRVRDGAVAEVANRRTVLVSRDADTMAETVVAANTTRLLIVQSARHPDFHAAVLARHLLYAERQGLTPLICLTKGELLPAAMAAETLQPFRATGYATLVVSALRGRGLPELRALLAGQVTAVIGLPGAGKSTLLAALAGPETALALETGAGRARVVPPRGARLAPDTWLINLPTLRELGVWKPDLSGGFREFAAYAAACPRPGCLHITEPGCAVRQALDDGRLLQPRYAQYRQLLQLLSLA